MSAPPKIDFRFVDMAMNNIALFAERVASRPNYTPQQSDTLILRNPACEHGCITCYMACAIAPSRLAWWEGELARLCGSSTSGRC